MTFPPFEYFLEPRFGFQFIRYLCHGIYGLALSMLLLWSAVPIA